MYTNIKLNNKSLIKNVAAATVLAMFSFFFMQTTHAQIAPLPPVFDPISTVPVMHGDIATFTVHAVSPAGLPITYSMGYPAIATIDPITGVVVFNTTPQTFGTFTINVAASDGVNPAVVLGVQQMVKPAMPVLVAISDQRVMVGENMSFTANASSKENNIINYRADLLSGATFDAVSRVYSWTPGPNDVGTYTIYIYASDGYYEVKTPVNITVDALPVVDPVPVPDPAPNPDQTTIPDPTPIPKNKHESRHEYNSNDKPNLHYSEKNKSEKNDLNKHFNIKTGKHLPRNSENSYRQNR